MKKNIIITLILIIGFIYNCSGLNIEAISEDDYDKGNSQNTEQKTDKKEDTYSNKDKGTNKKKNIPENIENTTNTNTEDKDNTNKTEDKTLIDIKDNTNTEKNDGPFTITDVGLVYDESYFEDEKNTKYEGKNSMGADFSYYFGKDVYSLNLFNGKDYSANRIVKITKNNEFSMFFPSDITNKTTNNGNWDIIWNGAYGSPDDNVYYDKDNLYVRFITVDRNIPAKSDNDYINNIFFGFLSNEDFKKLGIKQWKTPKFDFSDNLKSNFNRKNIFFSVVFSGVVNYPLDNYYYANYFVFTFLNNKKSKIVFLTVTFLFDKDVYKQMELYGDLKTYYNNWISFVSTFSFI